MNRKLSSGCQVYYSQAPISADADRRREQKEADDLASRRIAKEKARHTWESLSSVASTSPVVKLLPPVLGNKAPYRLAAVGLSLPEMHARRAAASYARSFAQTKQSISLSDEE